MNEQLCYPLTLSNDDHLESLPKLVGVILSADDDYLADSLFSHPLILQLAETAKQDILE
jgi:hypothetical protein